MPIALRIVVPIAVLAAIAFAAWCLEAEGGPSRELAFALLTGTAFGVVLQRARFCFLCNLRDFVEKGDPRGVLSILAALAAGVVGYTVVYGAWLPIPATDHLPPDAHIGPVSPALAAGAFVFGLGMAIAGSCISAHLYRLGEGSPTSPFALIGAFFGFCLGFLTWNPLFMADLAKGPVLWLPHYLGYAGSLVLSLALLGGLALFVVARSRVAAVAVDKLSVRSSLNAVFVDRWPAVLSGMLVAAIGTFAYLRFGPLGVTSQIGSASRAASGAAGLLPDTLYGLDSFRGCATIVGEALLTPNGHLIIASSSAASPQPLPPTSSSRRGRVPGRSAAA